MNNADEFDGLLEPEIAIIGMAGRFPGAIDVERFWQNLKDGVESISFFSDEELMASGVPSDLLNNPNYVKARAVLDDIDLFDAAFFGYAPREALIMDPQHRLFLECAWEAIENAGYSTDNYKGRTGVFAGSGANAYLFNLYSNRELIESVGAFQLSVASEKDFLTARVSYKLNLTGPSIAVQTACSTSLVAVHLACLSLLNGECDMALAGGVSIATPQKIGHLYQEGAFFSPDGRCRAFDAEAKGTVSGSGVGIVALKRLEDALADGDTIHAVIKGSAINNDGAVKASFTAPSVSAQAKVIVEAQRMARIDADTISFIEAHGTATPLGDPIEIAALTEAFRASTNRKNFCAVGSVKTNIGHVDAAAGVAGLIKVVQALKAKKLPPSLNFNTPNPKLDFANSPFYVNSELMDWQECHIPRRAGVSSFGIGGTNVHLIVEEAQPLIPSPAARSHHLLLLSAKTESALDRATASMAEYLNQHADINLADATYTLQVGRNAFEYRRMLVCSDPKDAGIALREKDASRVLTALHDSGKRAVSFMFSGQGFQYVNMGLELYESEAQFRAQVDNCSELFKPHLNLDLRDVLYPKDTDAGQATEMLSQMLVAHAALFVIEYALAGLWISWGVQPRAMIGHSLGEYVAACLADVLSLEDAISLVAARGRLMQSLPGGSMMAVSLPEEEARAVMGEKLSLAAINSPSMCVVSGSHEAVSEFETRLKVTGVQYRLLHISHASHSEMMSPILEPFTESAKKLKLNPPKIPYVSNLTGTWITAAEATDPRYWARHLRNTVRFSEGLEKLLKDDDTALLEIGPGESLTLFARQHLGANSNQVALPSLRHPQSKYSDEAFVLSTLGKLWLSGVPLDWPKFYAGQRRLRVPLPTYRFDRQRYWVESQNLIFESLDSEQPDKTFMSTGVQPRPRMNNAYVAPSTEIEHALVQIWQELFGIERIGIQDDFFNLGGHSLLATRLMARLNETFDIELPLSKAFEASTIAALAAVIDEIFTEKAKNLTGDEFQQFLK